MKNKNKLNAFDEFYVYGINGVNAVLHSDRCRINKIIVSDIFDFKRLRESHSIKNNYSRKIVIKNGKIYV